MMRHKTKHPLYNTYRNMKARCQNQKAPNFKWYGAKGIKVCERWDKSFQAFLDDMGPKPEKKWVLIRKDMDQDYSPDNCQWGPKGSEARRPNDPVVWEYALKFGEKVSKALPTLSEAKFQRDRLVTESLEKGRQIALEIVRRANGGEWRAMMVKESKVSKPDIQILDAGQLARGAPQGQEEPEETF